LDVRFLTPWGALFALAAVVPLAVFLLRQRRARRIRAALRLDEPSLASRLPLALALAAVPGLIGLAAAQPVVEESRSRPERTDAEAFVLIDITRSMLASTDPKAPIRLDRARDLAVRLRDELPEVPMGVVSLTDRVLPHAFPTTDRRVFVATIEQAIDIDRPGSAIGGTLATSLEALTQIPELLYFSPRAKKRLLVVLTDGESLPLRGGLEPAFAKASPPIETILVHFWGANERIYAAGVAEGGYRPQPGSKDTLDRVASLIGGRVFSEDEDGEIAAAAREIVGQGEIRARELEGQRIALMPYVTLAAVLPLGFLLLKRNF
jgi:von Willebrand factor type A domain